MEVFSKNSFNFDTSQVLYFSSIQRILDNYKMKKINQNTASQEKIIYKK